jgi:hypothetical protein
MLVTGPVDAGAVRGWLGGLPLDLGDRSLYDAAEALTGGRSLTGRISPPDGRDLPVRLTVDAGGVAMELDGPAGRDAWWCRLVTEAGRQLRADTVALVDDPSALLPLLLWVSTTALSDFADARQRAAQVESQWDGALLLHR